MKSSGTSTSTWATPMPRSSTRTVPTTGVRSTRPGTTHSLFRYPDQGRLPAHSKVWSGPHPQVRRRQASDGAGQAGVGEQAAKVVCLHRFDHPDVCRPAESGAVGIDRNVGQATDSTGAVHAMVEDAKIKRSAQGHRKRGDPANCANLGLQPQGGGAKTPRPLEWRQHRQQPTCGDTPSIPLPSPNSISTE